MPAPHHSVFTGRMLFLTTNQQRESTELVKFRSLHGIVERISQLNVPSYLELEMSGNYFLIPFPPIPNGSFPFPFSLPGLDLFSFPSHSHWLFPFPPHSYSGSTTANSNKYVSTNSKNNTVTINK